MMRRRAVPALLALAAICAALAGPAAFGKLAHALGFPGVALMLVEEPAARGAALYALGRYQEADAVFEAIGRSVTYNRANTLAATGRYALSVDYYDAVLFADRYDAAARHNREVVAALVDPVIGEAAGRGRIAALLRADGIAAGALDAQDPHAPIGPGERSLRKPVEARTVAADRAWLDTLADAPGEFLRQRLAAEHERRLTAGTAAPVEAVPW